MIDDYEDIINMDHYEPKYHPRMSRYNRAAQFAPFAALTGYEDAVEETARITDKKIELSEEEKNILDEKLLIIETELNNNPKIKVTYFIKDNLKDGGKYITDNIIIKKVDKYKDCLVLDNKNEIDINDILEIDSDIFNKYIY